MSRERKDQGRATLKVPRAIHTQLRLHAALVDESMQDVFVAALKEYFKKHKIGGHGNGRRRSD